MYGATDRILTLPILLCTEQHPESRIESTLTAKSAGKSKLNQPSFIRSLIFVITFFVYSGKSPCIIQL